MSAALVSLLIIELVLFWIRKKSVETKGDTVDDEEQKIECSIDPTEIPEVPANKFLQRSLPANRIPYDDSRRQRYQATDFEGRQVKGRGALRYARRRSRSSTPPHWKQEQERLRPLNEQKEEEKRRGRSQSPDDKSDRRTDHSRDRVRRRSRSRSRSSERNMDRRAAHRTRGSKNSSEFSDAKRRHDERTSDVESDFESRRPPAGQLMSAIIHRDNQSGKDKHPNDEHSHDDIRSD